MSPMRGKSLFRSMWLAGSFLILAAAGCGGIKTYPVSGKITYKDGTPMPGGGEITFNATEPGVKYSARGTIKDDGTFQMSTFGDSDGVPVGTYKVMIMPTPVRNPRKPPPGWPPLKLKYMNYKATDLQFTVTAGKNDYLIVVEK